MPTPTSFKAQRTLLRNIVLSANSQITLGETMADADLTYRSRPETNAFFNLAPDKESDYKYAGKGSSFATESRLIDTQSSGDITTRLDDFLAGWAFAFVMGQEAFTAGGVAPAAPTLASVAGGALAATSYYAKITYVYPNGESLPSAEATLAVIADDVLQITSPAASGTATGYNVYVSSAAGTETKQNVAPIAIGTAWTEPNTGLIAGAAPPVASTAPNTHAFTWLDTCDPAKVTNIYVEDGTGLKRKFQDMALSKLVLSGTDKGSITAKMSMIGTGRYADGAMTTLPALPTAQYLYGSDGIVSIGPAGAPVSMFPRVVSWEATFDHAIELFRACGGGVYPVFPRYGNPVNSLKLVIAADDTKDVQDWMTAQTPLEVKIAVTSGAASLTIDYPYVILPKSDLSEQNKYVAYTVDLDQNSILKNGASESCSVTVANTDTAYLVGA